MDSTTHAPPEADPRNKKKFYLTDTLQRRALVAVARALFKLVMKLEVVGLENFPPEGAVILAANHVTNFDVFPMQFVLPRPIFLWGKWNCSRIPSWISFCEI